jgi:hypothetical protein
MHRRWILLVIVAAAALLIGVLYGYLAGVAVVLACVTIAIFFVWLGSGGAAGEAERTGREMGIEHERRNRGT